MRFICVVSFLLCIAVQLYARPDPTQAHSIQSHPAVALTNLQIIDGTGSPAYLGSILMEGGRITEIIPGPPRSIPMNYLIEDFTGHYAIPGFVDILTHISIRSSINGSDPDDLVPLVLDIINLPFSERMRVYQDLLQIALRSGVTTFYDSVSSVSDVAALWPIIFSEPQNFPNFYSLGPIMGKPNAHPWPLDGTPLKYVIDTSLSYDEQYQQLNATFAEWFNDVNMLSGIKVVLDGPAENEHFASYLDPAIVNMIGELLSSYDKEFFFWSFNSSQMIVAANAGADVHLGVPLDVFNGGFFTRPQCFQHFTDECLMASPEALQTLIAKNVSHITGLVNDGFGMMTYYLSHAVANSSTLITNTSSVLFDPMSSFTQQCPSSDQYLQLLQKITQGVPWANAYYNQRGPQLLQLCNYILAATQAMGLRYVAAADAGSFWSFHGNDWMEMQAIARGNPALTPMEVLQMMTILPARAVRLDNIVGTLEAGKYADVVILSANPMHDIANTRFVRKVFKFGIEVPLEHDITAELAGGIIGGSLLILIIGIALYLRFSRRPANLRASRFMHEPLTATSADVAYSVGL